MRKDWEAGKDYPLQACVACLLLLLKTSNVSSVSAPMATMTVEKLQKFHGRVLRKQGNQILDVRPVKRCRSNLQIADRTQRFVAANAVMCCTSLHSISHVCHVALRMS